MFHSCRNEVWSWCVSPSELERVYSWFAYQHGVKHPPEHCKTDHCALIFFPERLFEELWYEEALWRLTIMSRFAQRCATQQEVKSGTRGFWLSSSMRALASKTCQVFGPSLLGASADVASTCCKKTCIDDDWQCSCHVYFLTLLELWNHVETLVITLWVCVWHCLDLLLPIVSYLDRPVSVLRVVPDLYSSLVLYSEFWCHQKLLGKRIAWI